MAQSFAPGFPSKCPSPLTCTRPSVLQEVAYHFFPNSALSLAIFFLYFGIAVFMNTCTQQVSVGK